MSDDYQPDLDTEAWQHVRGERPTEWRREQSQREAERLSQTSPNEPFGRDRLAGADTDPVRTSPVQTSRLDASDAHSAWEQRQGQRELRDDNQDLRDVILQLGARVLALEAALAAVRGSLGNPAPHVEDGPVSLTHEAPSAPPHQE